MVTADHGNAEEMQTKDGLPNTAHSLNDVFCAISGIEKYKMKSTGGTDSHVKSIF